MTGALSITDQMSRGYTSELDDSTIQQEAQYAIEWIEEALRAAGNNPYEVTTSDCPVAATPFQAASRKSVIIVERS